MLIDVSDGRVVEAHDGGGTGPAIVWFHGSPQTGALLAPLRRAAAARGVRIVSYARPSYGASSSRPGRDVASAAEDVVAIADALGLERFGVIGASGGGPHALACAAVAGERVTGAVTLAGLAPFDGEETWFAGMRAPGGLLAARDGREARLRFAETDAFDESQFTKADYAALAGPWAALGEDAGAAARAGPDGLVDDDVAFVAPWGFMLRDVTAPVLVVQGGEDRVVAPTQADRLLDGLARSELWLRPRDGHVSVLTACPVAMDWLLALQP